MTNRSYRLLASLALFPALAGAQATAKPAAKAAPKAAPARATVAKAPMMAAVDSTLFAGMKYRLAGHTRGGRVTSVTGVPSQPRTFYMGVASGGVFRTTNGGESWEPITDGKMTIGSIGSIAVAESNPNIMYVGTGSDGVRSNVSTGHGIYRTNDAGKTWSYLGLYNIGQVGAVRIHPTNPDIAWRLQDHRRRQVVEADAVHERQHGRDGCRSAARQSECRVRVDEPH